MFGLRIELKGLLRSALAQEKAPTPSRRAREQALDHSFDILLLMISGRDKPLLASLSVSPNSLPSPLVLLLFLMPPLLLQLSFRFTVSCYGVPLFQALRRAILNAYGLLQNASN